MAGHVQVCEGVKTSSLESVGEEIFDIQLAWEAGKGMPHQILHTHVHVTAYIGKYTHMRIHPYKTISHLLNKIMSFAYHVIR